MKTRFKATLPACALPPLRGSVVLEEYRRKLGIHAPEHPTTLTPKQARKLARALLDWADSKESPF